MLYLIFLLVCFFASVIGAICGIGGGIVGRALNRKIKETTVDKLFIGLMAVIIAINIYNIYRFS